MNKFFLVVMVFAMSLNLNAEELPQYNASKFGIKSDGITMNTRSIQKAIDWISENGGGQLNFWVGRYLTGSIHLRSNVTINLYEGAILVGSTNPYDYDRVGDKFSRALIIGYQLDNICIKGKGIIDGQGRELANNFVEQVHAGVIKDILRYDRTGERARLVYLRECSTVNIDGITMKNAADWVQTYDQCKNLTINNIYVESLAYWNNDGIDIVDCDSVLLTNSYINSTDDAICLKSHDKNVVCQNVEVRNCTARSSASGIKFGTFCLGGFKNIKIINNKVYDTFRSAITIQSVDGGVVENILVDSLYAENVGNAIYLVIGNRRDRVSSMSDITISNMYAQVAATKPDAGYEYEGPTEDNPRNISPSSVVGLKGNPIKNVHFKNIEIIYPGGGDEHVAYVGLDDLDKVPEMPKAYPEFSQHKELPAWGFFLRHVENISFDNVKIKALKDDYRTAIILDDVTGYSQNSVEVVEPDGSKAALFERK